MHSQGRDTSALLIATAPLAIAIGVFGTIYGAGASSTTSAFNTILSSALIFSGAVQFALLGLLLAGSSPALATAAMLNARNLLLGAALRPKLTGSRWRRALLAWWLVDETAGLALASKDSAARVLLTTGVLCYASWLTGTTMGVLGASLGSLEEIAAAVFPVLFVGLAAMSARDRDSAGRAIIAVLLSVALALALPQIRGLIPPIAALAVSLPGGRR